MLRYNSGVVSTSEPLVPLMLTVYVPAEDPTVVTVSAGEASGTAVDGLMMHNGRLLAVGSEGSLTVHAKSTVPVKLVVVDRVITAVAVPPGSTPAGGVNGETLRLKFCAAASGACAAMNKESKRAKTMARTTCLEFNMFEWELTTFDSSSRANAA